MTDFSVGGLSLPGAFAGTLLAVGLGSLTGLVPRPGELLDALAPAACLGIGC